MSFIKYIGKLMAKVALELLIFHFIERALSKLLGWDD